MTHVTEATPSTSQRIVLVHGSWLGGWIWDGVAERLRALGHDVVAPTLSGDGDLPDHVAEVVALLHDDVPAVLVAHSYGGMVAAGVAAEAPAALARVVFLDAFVPTEGQSAFAALPPIQGIFEANAVETGGVLAAPRPPAAFGVDDEAVAARILERMRPWPVATHHSPSPGLPDGVEASYVQLAQAPFFADLAADLEARGWPVERLDLPHLAPITHPDEIASAVARHAVGAGVPEELTR